MLDRYLWGSVSRVSPEAPVPVVKLDRRSCSLGGAANVANNFVHLGAKCFLAGYVGDDADAVEMRALATSSGIDVTAIVSDPGRCTSTKTRIFGEHQQLLRVDEEHCDTAESALDTELLARIEGLVTHRRIGAIVLSDYAKGVASTGLCEGLGGIAKNHSIPLYVDPKGLDFDKYAGATAIKPNRRELALLAEKMNWGNDIVAAAGKLREMLGLQFVALTMGAQGITAVTAAENVEVPAQAREVFDVSGAGDTVLATMVCALGSGLSLHDALVLSNLAAAEVVAQLGSTPIQRDDLLLAVQAAGRVDSHRKVFDLEDLQDIADAWRRRGLRIALTNGFFDLLHAGHVRLLEGAAAEADKLIVAINSDDSVRRLKGAGRPLMDEEHRIAVLSALEVVDAIVVYGEDTPNRILHLILPDILAKGDDYSKGEVVGREIVEGYGGEVKLIPLLKGLSTTSLASEGAMPKMGSSE